MSAEATRANTGDDAELAELRRRAYGPHADIHEDPAALARLDQLEARIRARFATAEPAPAPAPAVPARVDPAISDGETSLSTSNEASTSGVADTPGRPAPRWHTALLGATAVTAVTLGGIAWAGMSTDVTSGAPVSAATAPPNIPAVEDQDWSMSSAADFTNYLDGLRDQLLAGEGMESVADRVIREQLLPYGDLYGHTVWAGSTTDGEYCMIIDEAPSPSIGCISVEDAYASPRTIVLPARVTGNAGDAGLEPGAPISYTLLPGGKVVAEPSDAWTYPLG